MKTSSKFLAGVCLVVFIGMHAAAQDQETKGGGMMGQGSMMQGGGMMGKGGVMGMGDMCGMMMAKSMVATEDGGVIVSIGNKIYKYDKDLKLVKEGDLKIDTQAMQKSMRDMMEQCPMHNQQGQGKSSIQKSTGTATDQHGH